MSDAAKTIERTQFSVEELAARWGMSDKWVRRRIWAGELHAKRFGSKLKIPLAEVQRFEESRPAA